MTTFKNPFQNIAFPIYRRYKNSTSYFKIISSEAFEEKKLLNKRFIRYQFEAKTLPDRNYVLDLVLHYHDFAEEITAEDYEKA